MQQLFPKEEEIMYAFWSLGHPCVLSEILKAYPELKRNTLAKVVIILEKKGYLKVDGIAKTVTRTGRAYVPTIKKEDYEEQKELFSDVISSPNAQSGVLTFFSALIHSGRVRKEFLDEMEAMIDDFKKNDGA